VVLELKVAVFDAIKFGIVLAFENLGVVRSGGEIPFSVFFLRVEFECVVNEDSVLQGIEMV